MSHSSLETVPNFRQLSTYVSDERSILVERFRLEVQIPTIIFEFWSITLGWDPCPTRQGPKMYELWSNKDTESRPTYIAFASLVGIWKVVSWWMIDADRYLVNNYGVCMHNPCWSPQCFRSSFDRAFESLLIEYHVLEKHTASRSPGDYD